MKLQQILRITILTGGMTLLGTVWAFAATLGIVDYVYLEQQHRDYAQTMRTYDSYVQEYRTEFDQKYADRPELEKQKMVKFYNDRLNEYKEGVMSKIRGDILVQIKVVERERGLHNVAVKGYVLDGEYVDITNDVALKLNNR